MLPPLQSQPMRHSGTAATLEHPESDALNDFEHWPTRRAAREIGDTTGVVKGLERAIKMPSRFTEACFQLDPTSAPLRGDLRFERLVNGT
jgi:hypothetical protein